VASTFARSRSAFSRAASIGPTPDTGARGPPGTHRSCCVPMARLGQRMNPLGLRRPSVLRQRHLSESASLPKLTLIMFSRRDAPRQFRTRGSGKRTIQRAPGLRSTSNVPFS